jgi:hypothetical protein
MSYRFLPTLAATAALVTCLTLAVPGSASASVGDPIQTGCASDAYTVSTRAVTNSGGGVVGQVQVRYSPSCGTNWAKVVSSVGTAYIQAEVYTTSDWAYYSATSTSVYTDMVYAPNGVCAYAIGSINSGPWSSAAIGC